MGFNITRPRGGIPLVAGVILGIAVIGGGTATAANLITSKDVKNGTLTSADVKNRTLRVKDLSDRAVDTLQKGGPAGARGLTGLTGAAGAKGDTGAAGATGAKGDKGDAATYVGEKWSIIDRNVLGNGDSYLRAGPTPPSPLGQGSLGIRTGSGEDAASFGNQVDFAGVKVGDLTRLGYSVYTTAGNNSKAPNNMPGIKIEIDPNVTGSGNFSTLVYAPDNSAPNAWTAIDAVADTGKHWGFTGGFFNDPATMNDRCGINGSRCTFAAVKAYLAANNDSVQGPAAISFSVAIGKGRDFAFSGAADALVINNTTYDFEPFGVIARTP